MSLQHTTKSPIADPSNTVEKKNNSSSVDSQQTSFFFFRCRIARISEWFVLKWSIMLLEFKLPWLASADPRVMRTGSQSFDWCSLFSQCQTPCYTIGDIWTKNQEDLIWSAICDCETVSPLSLCCPDGWRLVFASQPLLTDFEIHLTFLLGCRSFPNKKSTKGWCY